MAKWIWWILVGIILGLITSNIGLALLIIIILVAIDQLEERTRTSEIHVQLLKNKNKFRKPTTKELRANWKCPNCKSSIEIDSDVKAELKEYNSSMMICNVCKKEGIIGKKKSRKSS
jgi:uncharacterized CHY-type Zn-finger protein